MSRPCLIKIHITWVVIKGVPNIIAGGKIYSENVYLGAARCAPKMR